MKGVGIAEMTHSAYYFEIYSLNYNFAVKLYWIIFWMDKVEQRLQYLA